MEWKSDCVCFPFGALTIVMAAMFVAQRVDILSHR
jgi:hypothetical protein